jgi:MFS family permease
MNKTYTQPRIRGGWPTFSLMWLGQVISLLGSQLTSFGLNVWVYQQTDSATLFALMIFFTLTPGIILGPFAGALVDRWDRRWVLILTDGGTALVTLAVFALFRFDLMQIWHLYGAVAISSLLGAFQMPAFQASIALLVPEQDLGRANGLANAGSGLVRVGAPALAGALLPLIDLSGIILIDVGTFLLALLTLLAIHLPRPEQGDVIPLTPSSLVREAWQGWEVISAFPGLVSLVIFFAVSNFLQGLVLSIFMPMLLSFTSAEVAGRVISLSLVGLVVGGVAMMVWGGPRRRMRGVLFGSFMVSIALIGGGLRADPGLITAAGFLYWLMDPIIFGSANAIWQSRIPSDIQGRVFSINRVITWSTLPPAFLLAGVLADGVFEPLMSLSGPLADTLVGEIFGVGPGRGIGLMFSLAGVLSALLTLTGTLYPRLRLLEEEIPLPPAPKDVQQTEE